MDKKIIFVHGYTASSKKDWYPKISKLLDRDEIDYSIPDLPGDKYPENKEWLRIIKKKVEKTRKPIILVGHSLGTRAVLLFLDQNNIKVKGVLLIAAFNNSLENAKRRGGNYANFFEYKVDIEKIKKQAEKFVVIHSRDDDHINFSQGKEIAKQLDAKLKVFENRIHFSDSSNAPIVFNVLKEEFLARIKKPIAGQF